MHDYRNTLILPVHVPWYGNSKENSLTCVLHVFGKLKKYAYFNTLLEGMDQKG